MVPYLRGGQGERLGTCSNGSMTNILKLFYMIFTVKEGEGGGDVGASPWYLSLKANISVSSVFMRQYMILKENQPRMWDVCEYELVVPGRPT